MKPDPKQEATKVRETWEPPDIETLGRITDLVQGDGKVGTQVDADPGLMGKIGGG